MEGAAGLESYCLSGDARVARLSGMQESEPRAERCLERETVGQDLCYLQRLLFS